ncbi:MAG: branched-chain amino acid ABC transporter permease [Candidatus Hodarchaeota archaeon]
MILEKIKDNKKKVIIVIGISILLLVLLLFAYIFDQTMFSGIIEIFISGSVLALILTLISLGYSLVYGVGHVINLSHGMFYFLTGYLIFVFSNFQYLNWPYPTAVILSLIIITIVGALTYLILIKPFRDNEIMILIITFSLGYLIFNFVWLLENVLQINAIPGMVFLPEFITGQLNIFGIAVSYHKIIISLISIGLVTLVILFINKSRFGKAIRAVSQDQDAARLMGINLDGVLLFTVTLSALLAGIAAFLYVPERDMSLQTGWEFLLLSMSVVILGGMGSIPGTVIGAFVLSYGTYFCKNFINEWVTMWTGLKLPLDGIFHLIVVILMLMIRPRGILGKKEKI